MEKFVEEASAASFAQTGRVYPARVDLSARTRRNALSLLCLVWGLMCGCSNCSDGLESFEKHRRLPPTPAFQG